MKININQIPPEGLNIQEDIPAAELDLDTQITKFLGPVKAKAHITKITNALSADVSLSGTIQTVCSRCLNELKVNLRKDLKFNYQLEKTETAIDLSPDIREEIILDYTLKPLCKPDCKGLCPKCGKNLNEGGCSCALT